MVSLLFFYSNDPSSNPGEVYQFSVVWVLKINKKRLVLDHFFKKYSNFARLFGFEILLQLTVPFWFRSFVAVIRKKFFALLYVPLRAHGHYGPEPRRHVRETFRQRTLT